MSLIFLYDYILFVCFIKFVAHQIYHWATVVVISQIVVILKMY